MKIKNLIFSLLLFFNAAKLFSQTDTLNKISNNKSGYKIKYFDLNFSPVDSNQAYFGIYIYYDNNRATFIPGKDWQVTKLFVPKEYSYTTKGKPVFLDGTIKRYDGADTLPYTIEIYKNGYPLTLTSYHHCHYHPYGVSEYLDFTKLYNNQTGSYYIEYHNGFQTNIKKYWYKKENRKWKKQRIKE